MFDFDMIKRIMIQTIQTQIVIGIYNHLANLVEEGLIRHIQVELEYWDSIDELSDSDKEFSYAKNRWGYKK
jgi:hypothetical protein